MNMVRGWIMLVVVLLVSGCGGSNGSDNNRERFALYAGFGSGISNMADTITATREALECFESEYDENGEVQLTTNVLETTSLGVTIPLAVVWLNNDLESQRVEVVGGGFKVSVYDASDDSLVWDTYQDTWFPDSGKDRDDVTLIRADEALSDEEKNEAIAQLEDLDCYQLVNEDDEFALAVVDIPQSGQLPPVDASIWPALPESVNEGVFVFDGWSADGGIEAVAGEYYAMFEATMNVLGELQPLRVRRDFTIQDIEG